MPIEFEPGTGGSPCVGRPAGASRGAVRAPAGPRRVLRRRGLLALAAAAAVAACVLLRPAADASPSATASLALVCISQGPPCGKASAVESLRRLGTAEAQGCLAALAEGTDDLVAVLALSALGRSDGDVARDAVRRVLEDAGRAEVVRAAALSAFCAHEAAAGRTWARNRRYVRARVGASARLASQAAILKSKYWPLEAE